MCDECEAEEVDEAWRIQGRQLHWTDPFIIAFNVVDELGSLISGIGAAASMRLASHANHIAEKRAFASDAARDIERIVGES